MYTIEKHIEMDIKIDMTFSLIKVKKKVWWFANTGFIIYSRWEEEYTMRVEIQEQVAELEEVKPNQLNI